MTFKINAIKLSDIVTDCAVSLNICKTENLSTNDPMSSYMSEDGFSDLCNGVRLEIMKVLNEELTLINCRIDVNAASFVNEIFQEIHES